jgi:hypothetical protein
MRVPMLCPDNISYVIIINSFFCHRSLGNLNGGWYNNINLGMQYDSGLPNNIYACKIDDDEVARKKFSTYCSTIFTNYI